jgi:hypothetical protein
MSLLSLIVKSFSNEIGNIALPNFASSLEVIMEGVSVTQQYVTTPV